MDNPRMFSHRRRQLIADAACGVGGSGLSPAADEAGAPDTLTSPYASVSTVTATCPSAGAAFTPPWLIAVICSSQDYFSLALLCTRCYH